MKTITNPVRAGQLVKAVRNRNLYQLRSFVSWGLRHYRPEDLLLRAVATVCQKLSQKDSEWLLCQIENNTYLPKDIQEKVNANLFKSLVKLGCEPGKNFVLTGSEYTLTPRAEQLLYESLPPESKAEILKYLKTTLPS